MTFNHKQRLNFVTKKIKNNRGLIFVTVLMIIIVMMVLVTSVISMNVSQVQLTEGEIQRIQAETLASGMVSYTFAEQQKISPSNPIRITETLGNIDFDVTSEVTATPGPSGTVELDIDVTY